VTCAGGEGASENKTWSASSARTWSWKPPSARKTVFPLRKPDMPRIGRSEM